jgi:hypothetical protein
MRQISESLQTLLNAEEEYAKELADSPYKQTVLDAFQRVKNRSRIRLPSTLERTKNADDEVKK